MWQRVGSTFCVCFFIVLAQWSCFVCVKVKIWMNDVTWTLLFLCSLIDSTVCVLQPFSVAQSNICSSSSAQAEYACDIPIDKWILCCGSSHEIYPWHSNNQSSFKIFQYSHNIFRLRTISKNSNFVSHCYWIRWGCLVMCFNSELIFHFSVNIFFDIFSTKHFFVVIERTAEEKKKDVCFLAWKYR